MDDCICTSFTLPLNQLVVSVKAATYGVKAVGPLSKTWVVVDDVPVGLRSVEFMMAFGTLIGKPVEVDSESLGKVGPVRLNIWCVDPVCVRGSVDVFPSSEGVRLRVRVKGVDAFQAPSPPPPSNSADPDDKQGDGLAGGQNPSGGTDPCFTQSEWDGLEPDDKELFKANAPVDKAQKDAGANQVMDEARLGNPASKGTPISAVCSNLPARP